MESGITACRTFAWMVSEYDLRYRMPSFMTSHLLLRLYHVPGKSRGRRLRFLTWLLTSAMIRSAFCSCFSRFLAPSSAPNFDMECSSASCMPRTRKKLSKGSSGMSLRKVSPKKSSSSIATSSSSSPLLLIASASWCVLPILYESSNS